MYPVVRSDTRYHWSCNLKQSTDQCPKGNLFRSISVQLVFYVFRLERAERRSVERVDVDRGCQRRRRHDARNADVAAKEEAQSRKGSAPTVATARVCLHGPPVRRYAIVLMHETLVYVQYRIILGNSMLFLKERAANHRASDGRGLCARLGATRS